MGDRRNSQFVGGIRSTPYSQQLSDCADMGDDNDLAADTRLRVSATAGTGSRFTREEDIVVEDVVGVSLDFHRWPDGHDLREAARAV